MKINGEISTSNCFQKIGGNQRTPKQMFARMNSLLSCVKDVSFLRNFVFCRLAWEMLRKCSRQK